MAFTISLYKTASENNRVVKALTSGKEMSGELRNQTSVLNPSIRIESADNISTYNYAYIPEFGRYYYISDITSVRTNCWIISLRCDVLMSYSAQIKALRPIIEREEVGQSSGLIDSDMPININKKVQKYYFPKGFTKDIQYVLTTSGGAID
jgi:hypothetical protein